MSGEAGGIVAGSPLERIQRRYAQHTKGAELFLPLPGDQWSGELVARITVPGPSFVDQIDALPNTPDWMADFVAATVAGLFVRGEDGKMEPLPGPSGAPLKFEADFGAVVGSDVDSPRAAVFAAFMDGGGDTPPVLNVLALGEFADKIERWLSNTSRKIAGAVASGR